LQELNIKKISQFIPSTTHTWCEPCDLYIALDKSDNNLPLSLAQAMSFGKAIIATEKLELHEFIQNDKNGILLKDANADELSQTIINLARKPEQMQEFGNNNYKFAKEKFSEEVIQEKIKYIFN
jgi:glycosyltransferase involved in cell wall biosynthesis